MFVNFGSRKAELSNPTCFVGLLDLLDLSVATATEDLNETLLVSSGTLDRPERRGMEGGREVEGGQL